MKRLVTFLLIVLACALESYAGTGVEDFITLYKDCRGAKCVNVKGNRLALAKPFLNKRAIAPLIEHIDGISLLKMQNADEDRKECFVSDMSSVLQTYVYYGHWNSIDGIVDVYVMPDGSDVVKELVVYNPAICTLYSLTGDFPVESLLKLKQ